MKLLFAIVQLCFAYYMFCTQPNSIFALAVTTRTPSLYPFQALNRKASVSIKMNYKSVIYIQY